MLSLKIYLGFRKYHLILKVTSIFEDDSKETYVVQSLWILKNEINDNHNQ